VRTKPRGRGADGRVPAIAPANVPPVAPNPPADALITFTAMEVRIPE